MSKAAEVSPRGRLYGEGDPFGPPRVRPPLRLSADELEFDLPGADRGAVDLARKGDELIVTAGPYRRILALPVVPARRESGGAALRDGVLRVRFSSGARSGATSGASGHDDRPAAT